MSELQERFAALARKKYDAELEQESKIVERHLAFFDAIKKAKYCKKCKQVMVQEEAATTVTNDIRFPIFHHLKIVSCYDYNGVHYNNQHGSHQVKRRCKYVLVQDYLEYLLETKEFLVNNPRLATRMQRLLYVFHTSNEPMPDVTWYFSTLFPDTPNIDQVPNNFIDSMECDDHQGDNSNQRNHDHEDNIHDNIDQEELSAQETSEQETSDQETSEQEMSEQEMSEQEAMEESEEKVSIGEAAFLVLFKSFFFNEYSDEIMPVLDMTLEDMYFDELGYYNFIEFMYQNYDVRLDKESIQNVTLREILDYLR